MEKNKNKMTYKMIKPFGENKVIGDVLAEARKIVAQREKDKNKDKDNGGDKPPKVRKKKSKVESARDYFKIENVNYRGKVGNYRLGKSLLEKGTQDELAERSLEARTNGELYCPDMPLIISIFDAVMEADNTDAKNFIQKSMREKYPLTLTRIIYNPQGTLDEIIHNYKQPNQYSFNENVVGTSGVEISTISDKSVLEKLTGRNQVRLDEIFNYINGTPTYISRVSSKPDEKDERVARLYAYSDRANLYFLRFSSYVYPCFGVGEGV